MEQQYCHLVGRCDPKTSLALLDIFAQTALEVCEGQQFDLDFETSEEVPIDEYLKMIRLKTAVMFAGCLKSGGRFACADEQSLQALYDLGIHLGYAFQLADDLLDVYADESVFGKAVGGDIKDNKKTFVYLKALELADESQKKELKCLFSTSNMDEKEKFNRVKAIFDAVNVKKITEEAISLYTDLCLEDIRRINTQDENKSGLLSLIHQLQNRQK